MGMLFACWVSKLQKKTYSPLLTAVHLHVHVAATPSPALQRRGVSPLLLVAETTGVLAASFMTILCLLARQTRLPGATDNTRYGEGRASPRPPAASSRTAL